MRKSVWIQPMAAFRTSVFGSVHLGTMRPKQRPRMVKLVPVCKIRKNVMKAWSKSRHDELPSLILHGAVWRAQPKSTDFSHNCMRMIWFEIHVCMKHRDRRCRNPRAWSFKASNYFIWHNEYKGMDQSNQGKLSRHTVRLSIMGKAGIERQSTGYSLTLQGHSSQRHHSTRASWESWTWLGRARRLYTGDVVDPLVQTMYSQELWTQND